MLVESKQILNKDSNHLTDQQVKQIRDFLYKISLIAIEEHYTKTNKNAKKYNSICESID